MKVNDAALQIYTIGQSKSAPAQPALEASRTNHLAQSRFADQLSTEEKKFIATNFAAETPRVGEEAGKGRFIDVVA